MPRIVNKHPLALRWFHWVNFPILAIMIWSGTLILWANDVYATQLYQSGYRTLHGGANDENPPRWLKVPDRVILRPDFRVLYSGDTLPDDYPAEEKRTEVITGFRLADGMAWHFLLAWFFALNGLAYVIFLLASGQWRHLVPQRRSLPEAIKVAVKKQSPERAFELARQLQTTFDLYSTRSTDNLRKTVIQHTTFRTETLWGKSQADTVSRARLAKV